jgi:hypothetical protein
VKIAGSSGAGKPTSQTPTSFTLQWSDGPTYFTDILMVVRKGLYGASYWNEGYQDKDIRCSFDLGGAWPGKTIPAGTERVYFLMRFGDDINSAEAGARHAADYRSPDEGFNEDEGCYVRTASPEGASFTLHGASTPRVNPAFRIKSWPGAAPSKILIGGRGVERGKGMTAAVQDGALLLQYFGTVTEDATVAIPAERGN